VYKHILLRTDGSKLATKAVRQGIALAKSTGAKTTVLNVMPEFQMIVDEGYVLPNVTALQKRFDEQTAKQAKKIIDTVVSEARSAGVKCATLVG